MGVRFAGGATRRGALAALLAGLGLTGTRPAAAAKQPTVARCIRHVRRAGKLALYERCLDHAAGCCRGRPASPEVCARFK